MSLIRGRRGKHAKMLGLDIGSASVKALELSAGAGGFRVESFAFEALPPNAVIEGRIGDAGEVGAAVRRARTRMRSRVSRAALAVAGPTVIARNIAMASSLTETEIEEAIHAAADRYIPFALEDAAFDFEVQGLSDQRPDQADVLLVACRKDRIARIEAVLEVAGLEAAVIEPRSQVLERVYDVLAPGRESRVGERVVAIADIGATSAALTVLVDGRCVFVRDQAFGGDRLTEAIQHRYSLSFQEAETAKQRGNLPGDYAATVLQPFNEQAAEQLSRSLRLFYSSSAYSDVDQVLLMGGAARTEGLPARVEQALAAPAGIADPFARLSLAATVDSSALKFAAPSLVLCCGLAMRSCE